MKMIDEVAKANKKYFERANKTIQKIFNICWEYFETTPDETDEIEEIAKKCEKFGVPSLAEELRKLKPKSSTDCKLAGDGGIYYHATPLPHEPSVTKSTRKVKHSDFDILGKPIFWETED